MHQNFLNTLLEFARGKEDRDNFIQKALRVCKVFKVKPLRAPKPYVPNLFCKERHMKDQKRAAGCSFL